MDDFHTASTIGECIRRLRNCVLMTQETVAAAAGVSIDPLRDAATRCILGYMVIRQGRFIDAERVTIATAAEIQHVATAARRSCR